MVFANCPGRGAHALRPYKIYYLLQIIKEMVLGGKETGCLLHNPNHFSLVENFIYTFSKI